MPRKRGMTHSVRRGILGTLVAAALLFGTGAQVLADDSAGANPNPGSTIDPLSNSPSIKLQLAPSEATAPGKRFVDPAVWDGLEKSAKDAPTTFDHRAGFAPDFDPAAIKVDSGSGMDGSLPPDTGSRPQSLHLTTNTPVGELAPLLSPNLNDNISGPSGSPAVASVKSSNGSLWIIATFAAGLAIFSLAWLGIGRGSRSGSRR